MSLDPRRTDPILLRLAALRARERKAREADPAMSFPPGWWQGFFRVCCRELPEYGVSILRELGMDEGEVHALVTMADEAFNRWLEKVE